MNLSFKSLLSFQPGGWSAVDMQGGMFGVNVRMPGASGQHPAVLQRAAFPAQAVDVAVLAQMGRTLAPDKFSLVTLLGRRDYQLFMVDKPAVREDEMEGSLRLAISPLIDYPVAEANLAWLDIPVRQTMGSRVQQLYVVVAKTDTVQARKALFDQARMGLQVVDIRETAQRNISSLLETDQEATCLICVEQEGVQLTITFKGELYLVRFISEVLLGKGGSQDREALVQAVERLALEIQRSFDFVRRNYPALNIKTLHVAPIGEDLGLVDMLKAELIEEVKPLDLADVFDFSVDADLKKPQVQAQFFHALGSALRLPIKN
jgi:MSHA biogenesis protein MshI